MTQTHDLTGPRLTPGPRPCSVPNCHAPAALMWQREATTAERTAHNKQLQEAAADQHALTAVNLQIHINELEQRQAVLPQTPEGEHVRRLIDDNLTQAKADLVAHQQARQTVPDLDDAVTFAVFGCQTHAPDLDHAAEVHAEHCSTAGPCGCPREGSGR